MVTGQYPQLPERRLSPTLSTLRSERSIKPPNRLPYPPKWEVEFDVCQRQYLVAC